MSDLDKFKRRKLELEFWEGHFPPGIQRALAWYLLVSMCLETGRLKEGHRTGCKRHRDQVLRIKDQLRPLAHTIDRAPVDLQRWTRQLLWDHEQAEFLAGVFPR